MIRARRASENDEVIPELCCDVCLKPIEVIGLAMAIWFDAIDDPGQTTNLYVVHKGECDKRLVAVMGGDDNGGWHELNYAFSLFMETAKLKP